MWLKLTNLISGEIHSDGNVSFTRPDYNLNISSNKICTVSSEIDSFLNKFAGNYWKDTQDCNEQEKDGDKTSSKELVTLFQRALFYWLNPVLERDLAGAQQVGSIYFVGRIPSLEEKNKEKQMNEWDTA